MKLRLGFTIVLVLVLVSVGMIVRGVQITASDNATRSNENRAILARVCVSNKERDAADASAAGRLIAVIDESLKNAGAPLSHFLVAYRRIVLERVQRHRSLSDVDCSKITNAEGLP